MEAMRPWRRARSDSVVAPLSNQVARQRGQLDDHERRLVVLERFAHEPRPSVGPRLFAVVVGLLVTWLTTLTMVVLAQS